MNAIYILWLRQLKRTYRSRARVLGSLAQPILFLLALGFGFGPIYSAAGGGNYIQFLAPGIMCMSVLFVAIFAGIEVIWDRQFGFLKETLVAPVSRFNIMLGRTLGGATVATAQGVIVFLISLLVGFRPAHLLSLPLAIVFMFLIAVFFTAMGTAIASRMADMQAFPIIMNFIVMPIFFLSGALFPFSGLPGAMRTIGALNPLSYGVDGVRGALMGMYHWSASVDIIVLTLATLVLVWLGGKLFSKIQI